jgi:SAM-dependent methyltransferase
MSGRRGPDRRQQRARWEDVASSLGDFWGAPSTRYYRACEEALVSRSFGSLRGRRLLKLDLWNEAINTRILDWMRAEGAEAYGLDWSSVVAHRARRNGGNPRSGLIRADIRELPYGPSTFDFVYTMGTIEHIDEYDQAIREVHRVLRPGGRAIIGVPNKWDPFLRPLIVAALDLFDKYPYSPEKSFSPRELRAVIEASGLQVIERTGILTLPGFLRLADLLRHRRGHARSGLMRWIVARFERLETRHAWPRRFGYLLTMVAERPR